MTSALYRRKSYILALGIALVAIVLAACGSPDPTATPRPSDGAATATPRPSGGAATATPQPSGRVPTPENPSGQVSVAVFEVMPGVGIGSAQAPVEAMQYWGVGEGLFAVDADGNITNKLATGYELAPDLSFVDITLRDDVVFHKDWGPLTAEDIVWTLNNSNANTNPQSIHGQAGDFAALFLEAKVLSPNSLRLPFKSFDLRWNGNFLNEQAQGTTFFSKRAFDDMGEDWLRENIISTGPFQVIEWIQDDRAVLEKVPYDHWYRNPEIERLTFLEVPEPSTRVAQLRTGQVDIASDIPLKDLGGLENDGFTVSNITKAGRVHEIIFSGNYWETVHPETGEPLDTSNLNGVCARDLPWIGCASEPGDMEEARNIRWALALAIDRELLSDTVLRGFGVPSTMEYIDASASYFKDSWVIPYDPQRAQTMMSQTAWAEGNFDIAIWTGGELGGGTGTNAELNDAIAGMWQALWPRMNVAVFKSAYAIIRPTLVNRSNTIPYAGDCDEGATTIPFDWPHGLTETSLTRGGFGCGVEIPRIAETYVQVRAELDIQERIRLNNDLIDYLYDQMIFAGTTQVPSFAVYNPSSIASWEGTPSIFATINEFEDISLVRR